MRWKLTFVAVVVIACVAVQSFAASDFKNVTADANGDYLWSEPTNWGGDGIPDSTITVYMGGWSVPTATVYGAATAMNIRGARDASASGSTLTIRDGGSVTIGGPNTSGWMGFLMSENGDFNLNIEGSGSLTLLDSGKAGSMYIDADGGESFLATAVLTGGTLNVAGTLGWGVNEWGAKTGTCDGSVLDVQGGVISVGDNLYVGSGDPGNPGVFKISGAASISTGGDLRMYEALLVIDGGDATINTTGIRLKRSGTSGSATLKLTGSGVSTINASGPVTINDGAILDVSGLALGDYDVIVGASIFDGGLAFAPATDPLWQFSIEDGGGTQTLKLTYIPEPMTMGLLAVGGIGILLRKKP